MGMANLSEVDLRLKQALPGSTVRYGPERFIEATFVYRIISDGVEATGEGPTIKEAKLAAKDALLAKQQQFPGFPIHALRFRLMHPDATVTYERVRQDEQQCHIRAYAMWNGTIVEGMGQATSKKRARYMAKRALLEFVERPTVMAEDAVVNADWVVHADTQEKSLIEKPYTHSQGDGAGEGDVDTQPINVADKSLLQKIIRKGLVESRHDIEVQRQDPTSPLYATSSFESLSLKPDLLKGVYAMGFNVPSKIQTAALPALMAHPPCNMIAQSQSGTGKTAAFVLAMLNRVDASLNYPQVLCLSPTYELAIQTGEVAAKMGQFCPEIKLRFAIRGEEIPRGSQLTEHVVIGTPGKVLDWADKYRFFDAAKIKVFVLDEADVMVATQGHQDQTYRIHRLLGPTCQMMLFSATYEEKIMDFARNIVPNAYVISLKREEESLDNIKQYYVMCRSHEEKYAAITNIYGVVTIGQAMIFCHTRRTATWLQDRMSKDGHAVAILTGDLTVEQRLSVLDRFREGKEKVLITTNVLARGIDVEQVTIVVNFDLPIDFDKTANCETYLHRIGRTGRFGKSGLAINLVEGAHALAVLQQIEQHFGKKITLLNAANVDEIERLAAD